MIENIEEIINRLKENGCRNDIVEALYNISKEDNEADITFLLEKYRQELQDSIDCDCRLIDCTDCLIFKLEHKG